MNLTIYFTYLKSNLNYSVKSSLNLAFLLMIFIACTYTLLKNAKHCANFPSVSCKYMLYAKVKDKQILAFNFSV